MSDERLRYPLATRHSVVHDRCMTRTTIDIDDTACAEPMRRHRLVTRQEA